MRIDIRNLKRRWLFRAEVDLKQPPPLVRNPQPGEGAPSEIYLEWDRAIDDEGHLRGCPVCGCRELFVRRDFPQITGFVVIVLAAVISMILMGIGQVVWALGVLAAFLLLDGTIYFFTGRCLVCYRCRSEFRKLPIRKDHPGWDLSIGEKYRQAPASLDADPEPDEAEDTDESGAEEADEGATAEPSKKGS